MKKQLKNKKKFQWQKIILFGILFDYVRSAIPTAMTDVNYSEYARAVQIIFVENSPSLTTNCINSLNKQHGSTSKARSPLVERNCLSQFQISSQVFDAMQAASSCISLSIASKEWSNLRMNRALLVRECWIVDHGIGESSKKFH